MIKKNPFFLNQGRVICRDSKNDDWLYIVKSGECKVFKKLRFDKDSYETYRKSVREKFNKKISLDRILTMSNTSVKSNYEGFNKVEKLNVSNISSKLEKKFSLFSKNQSLCTYLEMKRLEEGDVFGIHDIIMDNLTESFILASDGVECILINRVYFLKFLYPEIKLQLKFLLSPYPNDMYFFDKYFHSFEWSNFTQNEKTKATLFKKRLHLKEK